jgi:hypothetical protein
MILKPFYFDCLAHARIWSATRARARLRSSTRSVPWIKTSRSPPSTALDTRRVVQTRFHADLLAGHLELRDRP